MSEKNAEQPKLKQSLGLFDATAISVGAIIGAGIFVVTGIAAGVAGSALIVSMLIAAVIALFTALSFAELAAWKPKEGSVYEYTYMLVSHFPGFLVGWMWMLSNTFAGAAVSLGFAYYFVTLFPGLNVNLVAAILCMSFTTINYFGIRQSALFNNFLVIAKLSILAFFVLFGLFHVNSANFAPFLPCEVGVFYGAYYIFFAYGGFARASVIAEEVKDARRNVPRAILLSLMISTAVYMLVGVVAVGLVGAPKLAASNSPLTEAIGIIGNPVAVYAVSVGGLLATASVLLTSILGVSRMAYAMAKRNDIPQAFAKLQLKYRTPYYSVWIVGIIMTLLVLFMNLSGVVVISTFAMLFCHTFANVSAFRLKTRRLYPRIMSIIGLIACLALLIFILFVSPQAWLMGVGGLVVGTIYYVAKASLK